MATEQIKNFFFLFKREDFSDAQFNDYWLKHHTNLAQKVDPSIHRIIVPNFYQEPEQSNGYGSGLVETYHSDEVALKRLFDEPVFNQLISDEPNFVRSTNGQSTEWQSSTKLVATTEEIVIDRANKPAFGKLIVMCKCSPGYDRESALVSWQQAVRESAKQTQNIVGYVESLPMKTGMSSATQGAAQDFVDAVSEFYFADDLRRDMYRESDAFAAFLRTAESAFGSGAVTQIPVMEMRRR